MDTATVRPGQMLGIEINPRAAVIAELVLWIGYLQWHLRTAGDVTTVSEPVLEDAKNIEARDAILAYDDKQMVRDETGRAKTHWDGRTTKPHPVTGRPVPDEKATIPVYHYKNPRPAQWPQADFIVGNPPFIGKGRMRDALGDGYTETLRKAIKTVPESADYVMYWWDHAADLVRAGKARRFGFITTNSIRQTFNRRVIEQHLHNKNPLSLTFAIPDHPWVDDVDAAAVRVAMTVGGIDTHSGLLQTVKSEQPKEDSFEVTFRQKIGKIFSDLTIGADVSRAVPLSSNLKVGGTGLILGGRGFVITKEESDRLVSESPNAMKIISPLVNGEDIVGRPRGRILLDTHGLSDSELRQQAPAVWQHLYETVYPERKVNRDPKLRANWWLFRRSNELIRSALRNLPTFIATPETAKHRIFVTVNGKSKVEHGVIAIALPDNFFLGVLSSKIHVTWALAQGGILGPTPRYNKTRCFETFPFPDCTEAQKARIRELGEALDAHRKDRQAAHPDLTMTGMYNVLEKLHSGETLTTKEKTIHEHGLVSILKQLHDDLDAAVAEAYGWPSVLPEEEILTRLVALNHERAEEEKQGHIRWLRPEYQTEGLPSEALAKDGQAPEQQEIEGIAATPSKPTTKNKKPRTTNQELRTIIPWPKTLPEQARILRQVLEAQTEPVDPATLAKTFKGVRKDRIEILLGTLEALGHAHEQGKGRYSA
ncbi:MAG: hypothetical protein JJT75_15215 [Opitutales bacterium]|nr:hypothetical protein [Opitutales bacterium]